MAKRGRPPKKPEERMMFARFGMTQAELQALTEKADARERSVSEVIRAMGTAAIGNEELLDRALADLDAQSGGVAIPPASTDT